MGRLSFILFSIELNTLSEIYQQAPDTMPIAAKPTNVPLQEKDANASAPTPPTNSKSSATGWSAPGKKSNSKTTPRRASEKDKPDLKSVHLDGEDNLKVPIYDTCDDVRRNIEAHLRKTSKATKAGFARELNDILPSSTPEEVNAGKLTKFLKFIRA